MKVKWSLLAVLSVFVSAHAAPPLGTTITWTPTFPKSGTNAGEIAVDGFCTVPVGTTYVSAAASVWPKNGGGVISYMVTLDKMTGRWGATLTGLTSGKEYNVTVTVGVKTGDTIDSIVSSPAVVTAK